MAEDIESIDEKLGEYYKKYGNNHYFDQDGIGKFEKFCDKNGFEDETVITEMEGGIPEESLLVDFDDDFPLGSSFIDKKKKEVEIFKVLKYIYENNEIPDYTDVKKYIIDLKNIDILITNQLILDKTVKIYTYQLSTLGVSTWKDKSLIYFLAISYKNAFPFLTYIIDSYTIDSIEAFTKTFKHVSLNDWCARSSYMIYLRTKYPQIQTRLQSAMHSYSNRIMRRLLCTSTVKIGCSMETIFKTVLAVGNFISKLINQMNGVPPFQIDLLLAVNVKSQIHSDDEHEDVKQIDSGDEDELKDEKSDLIRINNIKSIKDEIEDAGLKSACFVDNNSDFKRSIFEFFADFKTLMSKEKSNAEYPCRKRFEIFTDKRRNREEKTNETNEYLFFEPPDNCDTIPLDHVNEWYFDAVRTCLIPQKSNDKITALTNTGGELLTFSFHVEQKDEIKCYIIWNSETTRLFGGSNISAVLPTICDYSQGNEEFIKSGEAKRLGDEFDRTIHDVKFTSFYNNICNFKG
eukprot:111007_1